MQKEDWAPWEFYKTMSKPLMRTDLGPTFFIFPDPYVERILLWRKHNVSKLPVDVSFLIGSEITPEFIEENFQSADLFSFAGSESRSFFIHLPELMNEQAAIRLSELKEWTSNVYISYSGPGDLKGSLKTLAKKLPTHTIRAPKFWEGPQLLDLVTSFFDLDLNFDSQRLLLDCLPLETGALYNQINILKTYFYGQKVVLSPEQIGPFLQNQKLDYFQMANLYGRRQFKAFYESLLSYAGEEKEWLDFFRFMEGHLIKLYDPSFIEKKPRPTKYDKEIQDHARLWQKNDLYYHVMKFSSWLIKAKRRDPMLINEIRLTYLNSI